MPLLDSPKGRTLVRESKAPGEGRGARGWARRQHGGNSRDQRQSPAAPRALDAPPSRQTTCLRLQLQQVSPQVASGLRVIPDLGIGVEPEHLGCVGQWQGLDGFYSTDSEQVTGTHPPFRTRRQTPTAPRRGSKYNSTLARPVRLHPQVLRNGGTSRPSRQNLPHVLSLRPGNQNQRGQL